MDEFDEFDEQTDFSFLNLTMSEPEADTVKKSRSAPSDSPDTFNDMIVSWTWNHTPESRAKISAATKGKVFSDEHRARISAATRGRVISDEWKAKISLTRKLQYRTPDQEQSRQLAVLQSRFDPNIDRKIREAVSKAKSKKIMTPDGVFSSRNAAAKHYSVSSRTMSIWTKSKPEQFYYITKD